MKSHIIFEALMSYKMTTWENNDGSEISLFDLFASEEVDKEDAHLELQKLAVHIDKAIEE